MMATGEDASNDVVAVVVAGVEEIQVIEKEEEEYTVALRRSRRNNRNARRGYVEHVLLYVLHVMLTYELWHLQTLCVHQIS